MEITDNPERLSRAYKLLTEKNYTLALQLLSDLMSADVLAASTHLGYMYEHGLGTKADEDKAIEIYRVGAINGIERSQIHLAKLLFIKQRYSEALKWYTELHNSGSASSAYWLYVIYRDGLGVATDKDLSRIYLNIAAKRDHIYAIRDLSRLYMRGEFGLIGIFKGVYMFIYGICKMAFALANEPTADKLH